MTRFLFTRSRRASFCCPIVVLETENRQPLHVFISAAESALAGIAALVPVGSAPAPSHKKPEPQRSCPACGTYRHGLNALGRPQGGLSDRRVAARRSRQLRDRSSSPQRGVFGASRRRARRGFGAIWRLSTPTGWRDSCSPVPCQHDDDRALLEGDDGCDDE